MIVEADGYEPQAKLVQISNGHKEATRVDFDLVAVNDEDAAADDWMMYNDVLSQQVLFYLTILTFFCKICTFFPIEKLSNLWTKSSLA